ncbi:MAG: UDP-2,3-diacylglucosamine diphosphatase [Pseudomonadales bacterium]
MACKTLFISDLHLDESAPHITQALLEFLSLEARGCDALYILGDLFEAWIGDDDDQALNSVVSDALRELVDTGCAVYLMHGNRDFLLGDTFCSRAGATLLSDPTVVELYGTETLLMHGDSLCTSDTEYIEFRKKMRNPLVQAELLSKPLAERRAIASQLRSQSREAMSNKAEDIMDVTLSEVATQLRLAGVQRLIHGHTHRPAVHKDNMHGTRIVLGDWGAKLWFLAISEEGYELIEREIS